MGTFDFADTAPPTESGELEPEPQPEFEPQPVAHAIEGPPDSVSGFSDANSGPLTGAPEATEPERPAIGYQQLHATDSPLDLPDMDIVESHAHAPAEVQESRDPLLSTFADVAESTADVDAPLVPRQDLLAERFLEVTTNDEDHAAEAGAEGIENRVVHHGFAVGTHGIELLQAAVAAAHAGSQDEECWGHSMRSVNGIGIRVFSWLGLLDAGSRPPLVLHHNGQMRAARPA